MKKIILGLILLLSSSNIIAQTTKKVCFLGNSYTYYNDMPGLIESMAIAEGNTLIKDQNTPGGYTLEGHTTNATSLAKISSNTWDYVVLQDQSQRPSFPYSQVTINVYPKAAVLSDSIRSANECATPIFFNTWGRLAGDSQWDSINTFEKMNNRLFNAYNYMANANNGKLSPVGIGFRHIFEDASTIVTHQSLYSNDGSHPSIIGSYLAACIFYNVIFEETPIGNSYLPVGVSNAQSVYIQNVAHHVVNDIDSVTVDFSDINPTADFTYTNSTFVVNFTNTSINGTTYIWNFGDGNTSSGINPTHTYSYTGNYDVVLTAINCGKEDQITINVIVGELGIENEHSPFSIYPNPSKGLINIILDNKHTKIYVYNVYGQIINTTTPVSKNIKLQLQKGMYFIQVGRHVRKIIITK